MEPRNFESGAAVAPPSAPDVPSSGYPTGGNPSTGTPATKPGAHWFYKIGEELRAVIVAAGKTPNDSILTQLVDSITTLIRNTSATESAKGSAEIATQAEVDAGTDDSRFVTPLKLRFGFSSLLATNGYIVFPSWLGGLIIQWGAGITDGSGVDSVTLPIAFPNAIRNVMGSDFSTSVNATASIACDNGSLTSFNVYARDYTGVGVTTNYKWIAIGN